MDFARRSDVDSKSDCGEVESGNLKGENRKPRLRFLLSTLAFLLLSSCAGNRHFRAIPAEGPPPTAQHLELRSEHSVATLHFPAGIYSLQAVDDAGFYYRAPRKIVQHTAASSVLRDGGIFVSKRNPAKLRGYVYYAGTLTHVGNLAGAPHEFGD